MPHKHLLLAILLSIPFCLYAQTGNYNIYNYNTENGLPTNNCKVVLQDSYGYLWTASYDGLSRWDGYSFKKYNHEENNVHSLDNNIVYSIFEDSKRRLWVGTIEGLSLYNRETDCFIRCKINNKIERTPVNEILQDTHGQLWLGTSNGLCKYDYDHKTAIWYSNFSSEDVIFCMTKDATDNLWIGTLNKGIRKFSQTSKTYQNFHTTNSSIKSILADSEHNIWVGTENDGLLRINEHGETTQQYNFKQHGITSLYEDSRKTIWIGVDRKTVCYINKDMKEPQELKGTFHNNLLSISTIREDSFGNIWFGSRGNGLFYTNKHKNIFRNYLQDPAVVKGLETSVITCFYEDLKGNIWMGTDRGGLLKFDPSEKTFINYNTTTTPFSSDAINEIKGDDKGILWLATWGGGIIQFDPVANKATNYSTSCNDVKMILADDNDSLLWIGTHGQGLSQFNKQQHRFINNKSAPAWINHLFKDSRKRLWISTYSGIFMIDGKKMHQFRHSRDTNSISSNSVNMVTEDHAGRIWVISEFGGLDQFRNNRFIHFTKQYKLPETMKGIVADQHDVLWISSNSGIVAFDPHACTVKRFESVDGLPGNSFCQKAVLSTRDGQLYFGGPDGFTYFHPDSLEKTDLPTPFYFTDLYIYNDLQRPMVKGSPLKKVLPFTNELTLTNKQSFFSIGFSSVNLYAPSKTQYAYKLDGLDNKWTLLGNEHKVSFAHLAPGSYALKMKYTGTDGEWHVAPNELHITVLPPWWQTWWFRLIILLLITTVIFLRIRNIKKRNTFLESEVKKRTHEISTQQKVLENTVIELEKVNNTKDHFFSILAHDLKDPVAALTDISDFMKNNFFRMDRKDVQQYLNTIHQSGDAVHDLLINLLNWSRTQSKKIACTPVQINLQELVHKNIRLLRPQFDNKHIDVQLNIPSGHNIFADLNMMDTVFRNLLSNSIKYTEYNGRVSITSQIQDSFTTISVTDNGIGMSSTQQQQLFCIDKMFTTAGTAGEKGTGLGLIITKEFIEANNGHIDIKSEPGKGTTFDITLPHLADNITTIIPEESLVPDFWEAYPVDKLFRLKGKKILIVDDNKALRDYLQLILSGTFKVFEAENGQEGLHMMQEIKPDIIISDLMMPVMNGLQFCKEIKANASTPVIMLTSQWVDNSRFSGYEAGADAYLTKPVKKELLLQIILNLIRNQEQLYPETAPLNKPDEEFLHKLVLLIEDNITDTDLDAKRICKEMMISRTVLYAKMKTLTGQTVHEFIKTVRLKKSLTLLMEGKLSINQIASQVGFNSHSYFDKCFVKQYGVGPKEYISVKKSGAISKF